MTTTIHQGIALAYPIRSKRSAPSGWITKIAATFWSALGLLTPERRRKVLEVKDYETQRVYW